MSNMMERIEVFQDTFAWIKEDPKLKESISISAEKTQIFYENDYPSFDASLVRDQKVTVSMDRSFQAAIRIRKEHPDSRIAVLNFANAFYPGGGVEAGASAPDLSTYSSDRSPGGNPAMSDATLFGYHVKRALHILTAAAAKGADILVTGAFGCGAFRNEPKVVANAWRTALSVFPKVFERVEFAVYCTDEEMENYRVFRDMFVYLEV